MANVGGRPQLTPEQVADKKREVLSKIEPYLKSGLSVRKALNEAHVNNRDFYDFMSSDEGFREQINTFRQFTAVLLNNAIVREIQIIIEKQNGNPQKKIAPQALSPADRTFLQWYALNSNLTKDEFGERKKIELFDPEAEIQKVRAMLEGDTTTEIIDVTPLEGDILND